MIRGFNTVFRFFTGLFRPKERLPRFKVPASPYAKTNSTKKEARDVFATGSFEHVSLYELLVTLTHSRKSGKITIQIGPEKALILVQDGELFTAIYQNKIGDQALFDIFGDIDEHKDSEFFIRKLDPSSTPASSRTIYHETDKLLFNIALHLDNKRAAA